MGNEEEFEITSFKNGRHSVRCPYCKGEDIRIIFRDKGLHLEGKPCENPEGLPKTEFELNVPSGIIVFANDMRPAWSDVVSKRNVNYCLDKHLTTLDYASNGLAHGFVGNTSPCIFQKDNSILLGHFWEEEDFLDSKNGYEKKGSICTDLWWFSASDKQELAARMNYFNCKFMGRDFVEVSIEPGVYKVTLHNDVKDNEKDPIFVKFTRVRASENNTTFSPEKEDSKTVPVVEALIQKWSQGVYSSRKTPEEIWEEMDREKQSKLLKATAFSIFNERNQWHPNGFPILEISPKVKDLARWYGPLKHFPRGGLNIATNFYKDSHFNAGFNITNQIATNSEHPLKGDPEWLRVLLLLCRSIIKFGDKPTNHLDLETIKSIMTRALACYRKIRENFPEVSYEKDFDLWSIEHAEKHIENFKG